MEHKTMYRCTGTCGGVSPEPKNCGAADCTLFDHPLQKVAQCDSCAAQTAADGNPHACANCTPA